MRSIILAVLGMLAGYAAGAATGLALVALLSSNQHDRLQEMAMTAAFVTGPIGALLGSVAALAMAKRRGTGR